MRGIVHALHHALIAGVLCATSVAGAQGASGAAQTELITALAGKHISLERGLASARVKGTPISAKYEYEGGQLQLSVYTERAGAFFEVIVNHHSGKLVKSEKISEGDDFKNAQVQSMAIAKTKGTLAAAVSKALAAHPGSSAVSVTARDSGGKTVAEVTLLKGHALTTVTEPIS